MQKYELVMWLETHVRLKSKTKMFCWCKNAVALAKTPNENTCPICMWFPWMLPVLNEEVVNLAVKAINAMKWKTNLVSIFDRKSYFYPDSPSAYQITQLFQPIMEWWEVTTFVEWELKTFKIERMHLENDAWKLSHSETKSLCDYNRAWSPLMEIVTTPTFRDKTEVQEYLKELQKILRWCGASDADMEKWQLRCDVNISIRPFWQEEFGTRVEYKNLNSFSAIWRCIDYEYRRQVKILESGWTLDQETRWWDDAKWIGTPQRSKEDAMDYRYFPEPDLPPLVLTKEYVSDRAIDSLPLDRRLKYLNEYKLTEDDARILSLNRDISDYYEELVKLTNDPKKSCSYITTVLLAIFKESDQEDIKFSELKFDIKELWELINLVNKSEISSTNAKIVVEELFKEWWESNEIIDKLWLRQTNDMWALEKIVDNVIKDNPKQVEEYKAWNERLFWFFVWQSMKASKWQGNPKVFNEILKKKLS